MQLPDGWQEIEGWCTDNEAGYLYDRARALPKGSVAVEVGAWHGKSTIPLAMGCQEGGSQLISVDNWAGVKTVKKMPDRTVWERNLQQAGLREVVTLLEADSVTVAQTVFGPIRLVYIDGEHQRDSVRADIDAWLPRCATDGGILFHDYVSGWVGVGQAVREAQDAGRLHITTTVDSIAACALGTNPNPTERHIFWTMLMERNVNYLATISAMRIASRCARLGYAMLSMPYTRTDDARNTACLALLKAAQHDTDTIVMLDSDHDHPPDVVERLVAHNVGVVGALYYRRSEPYDPMVFFRDAEGALNTPADWDPDAGLIPCTIVGTGAIAIQAGVLRRLMESGVPWPWFRYVYNPAGQVQPTEDIYFGLACETVGIPHHVDFSLTSPHLTTSQVNERTFRKHMEDHPDAAPRVPELETQVEA